MVSIKPLTGLRPRPDIAAALAAVPYDVVDTSQARQLAEGNPHSFLRITRSELELSADVDPYSEEVYDRAAENLQRFIRDGLLIEDRAPSLYVYRLQMGRQVQTGVMAGVSVDDYRAGRIKIHEKTRPEKEDDRVRHILRLRAHAEPVFLAFRSDESLRQTIAREAAGNPLYDFTAPDGIRHTIWRASDGAALAAKLEALPHLYIADGHHRAASAARVATAVENSGGTGSTAPSFLAVLFPHSELAILPYNRVIKRLPREPNGLLSQLEECFTITHDAPAAPERKGEYAMYLGNRWYGLRPKRAIIPNDPVAALDVSVLSDLALAPIFNITDQRTDKNIDFVGGIHGTQRLEELVRSGAAACAFSLAPVSIEELFAVADRGLLMAPKSTWFEPKLRSGLFVLTF